MNNSPQKTSNLVLNKQSSFKVMPKDHNMLSKHIVAFDLYRKLCTLPTYYDVTPH